MKTIHSICSTSRLFLGTLLGVFCTASLLCADPLPEEEPRTAPSTGIPTEAERNNSLQLSEASMVYRFDRGTIEFDVSPPVSMDPEPEAPGEWLIAPVPGYSPVVGATLAGTVAKIYRPEGVDKEDPAWITGGGVFGAQNGSWGLGFGHKMNLGGDRWRISAAGAYADVYYRYYGIGNDQGDLDRYVPLRQSAPVGSAKTMFRAGPGWYVGASVLVADTTINLDTQDLPPGLETPPGWEDISQPFEVALNSVTPTFEYDSRDDEFFPRQGILFSGEASIFSESFGSDFEFQVYTLEYNQYFPRGDRDVIAVRTYARVSSGDVPFFALSTLGQGSDIRGYTPGRYRDNALVAGQVEYRHEFSDRWCVVTFIGIGAVGPSIGEIPRGLPAAGFGVRYRLAKESKVGLRMDAAWGRDDQAVYLSVGEAF